MIRPKENAAKKHRNRTSYRQRNENDGGSDEWSVIEEFAGDLEKTSSLAIR